MQKVDRWQFFVQIHSNEATSGNQDKLISAKNAQR